MEKIATRIGYSEALVELGKLNSNIVVLDVDVSQSTKTVLFKNNFPDRFFNLGVAEQNVISVAGGLSLAGKIPFVGSYGAFITGRGWDQLKVTVCYSGLNVKIGGSHTGVTVGPDGATHHALEDIALMRVLPLMTVVVPCDTLEAKKATFAVADLKGPCYIRLSREPVPIITSDDMPFIIGKANILKEGSDVTIIACGFMVYESMQAAEILEEKGIKATVVNMHTIKPLDENLIIKLAKKTKAVVTCEEHQAFGGLGGAVAEVLSKNFPVPIEMIAVNDSFGESGTAEELLKKYKLKDVNIVDAVEKVLKRKK